MMTTFTRVFYCTNIFAVFHFNGAWKAHDRYKEGSLREDSTLFQFSLKYDYWASVNWAFSLYTTQV